MITKTSNFSLKLNNPIQSSNNKLKIADYPCDEFVKSNTSVSFKRRNHDFVQVSKNYFRGKMPDAITLSLLKAKGINTIIDLTGGSKSLKQKVNALGMDYHNIPLDENIRPSEEEIKAFKKIVNAPEAKVYAHCREGRNRTGIMTAIYEVTEKGKPFRNALVEMIHNGYDFINYPDTVKFLGEISAKHGEDSTSIEKTIQELTSNIRLRNKLMEYNGIY